MRCDLSPRSTLDPKKRAKFFGVRRCVNFFFLGLEGASTIKFNFFVRSLWSTSRESLRHGLAPAPLQSLAMALVVTITWRETRLPLLLLRSLLLNPLSRPSPPLPPRSPAPSALFFSSLAPPSPRRPPFGAQPQSPLLNSLRPSPASDSGDFESDSDQPKTPVDESELDGFFQLLSQAKSLSSSPRDALAFLRASSDVEITRDLVCKALWELRWDWESALLALRWAEEHVLNCPWAWHLMLWVLGREGRFDLAWWLVRRLYRKSILTQRAMVIMMER